MRPPSSQTAIAALASPVCAATSDGVLKIPAPTTMPTISATPSRTVRAGLGAASVVTRLTLPQTKRFDAAFARGVRLLNGASRFGKLDARLRDKFPTLRLRFWLPDIGRYARRGRHQLLTHTVVRR